MKRNGCIIEKYLSRHAEKEIFALEDFCLKFSHVLTIPTYNETIENINKILDSLNESNTLVILVVNAMTSSSDSGISANVRLIKAIQQAYSTIWKSKRGNISLNETKQGGLLLVNRSTNTLFLPPKTGVGLARKIAADMALQLIQRGNVTSPWIHCTDADVVLPDGYFHYTKNIMGCSAAVYPYIHSANTQDPIHLKALAMYEFSLRHYVEGLRYAGSQHAYHTIGSTLAIHYESYTKVRGFPIRESGEDFYILNKLSKVGNIAHLEGNPIIIEGRISDRVPFGTGKSIEKIAGLPNMEENYLFYNPVIFDKLKIWIDIIKQFNAHSTVEKITENLINQQENHLLAALENIGAFSAIQRALSSSQKEAICQKHLTIWFDSFRTLKLIHTLRELGYPSVPLPNQR